MYLSKSSFVAFSPAGNTWAATWCAMRKADHNFRRPLPTDSLGSWPDGPPMGIISQWPSGSAPNYLDRMPALLDALGRALSAEIERFECSFPGARWGVVVGSSHGDSGPGAFCAERGVDELQDEYLGRVVSAELGDNFLRALNRKWPVWLIHGACASGLFALQAAEGLISAGELDIIVVVCADTLSRVAFAGFHRVGAMSARGCTPFDLRRDGMTLSEAGAALICTRERVHGEQVMLLSVEVNCDGSGTVEPSVDGVEAALASCITLSKKRPSEIDFIYWHGTGTRLNDAAEFAAAMRVFPDLPPLGTSTKGSIGHSMGASALLNVMAACETLLTNELPRCGGMSNPEFPGLRIASVTHHLQQPRVGMCVALGFGGINAAALLVKQDG